MACIFLILIYASVPFADGTIKIDALFKIPAAMPPRLCSWHKTDQG